MPTQDQVLNALQAIVNNGGRAAAKFTKAFEEDPSHALYWSNKTFEAIAHAEIAKKAIASLTDEESAATLKSLSEWATEDVLIRAASPPHSTNPTSNLMNQYEAAGWARVAQVIRRGF